MSMEITLINQIEKFECLYNYNIAEYNRKDLVDEAWADIAVNTNISVSDCKEKWRNIRSSFLRSMKPSKSKIKKPYYLSEYLKFIVPYLRLINVENTDDGHYGTQSPPVATETVMVDCIKAEPDEYGGNENNGNNSDNGILSDLLTQRAPVVMRRRRRFIPIRKRLVPEVKSKNRICTIDSTHEADASSTNNKSAMKMFLMSLLPELETMTEDQIRLFKIKSLMLIDDIKVNYEKLRENSSSINTERLQKRLINLLLKSLQRSTLDS